MKKGIFVMSVIYLLLYTNILLGTNRTDRSGKDDLPGNYISIQKFGAKGDGVTDDHEAIEKTIEYCIKNKKVCYIPATKKGYLLKSTVRVPMSAGDSITVTSNNAIIKLSNPFNKEFLVHLTAFQENVLFSLGPQFIKGAPTYGNLFDNNKNIFIKIDGLILNGSSFPIIPLPDHKDDIVIGLQLSAEKVVVSNCEFRNIFGYGMMVHGPLEANIINNDFKSVGGRGKTPFTNKEDTDQFGDAMHISAVHKNGIVNIDKCNLSGIRFKNRRSRCGITFEFGIYPATVNITNSYIQGYAKGIHIEEKATLDVTVKNTDFDDFSYGIANVVDQTTNCEFYNCKFNVGPNDNQDAAGASLLGLVYKSSPTLSFYDCEINYKNCGLYQAIAHVKLFKDTRFNANSLNIFFADADDVTFDGCTFNNFGGNNKSFFRSGNGKMAVTIKNSFFNGGGDVKATDNNVNVQFINSRHSVSKNFLKSSIKN